MASKLVPCEQCSFLDNDGNLTFLHSSVLITGSCIKKKKKKKKNLFLVNTYCLTDLKCEIIDQEPPSIYSEPEGWCRFPPISQL